MTAQRGLTLLELLVAIVIMALSLAALYRILGSSVRNVSGLDQRQGAMVLAQSLLSLRDAVPEGGWQQQGESAGYEWKIQSSPYETGISGSGVPALHQIVITIAWHADGAQRDLQLTTLRPQRKPPVQVRQ